MNISRVTKTLAWVFLLALAVNMAVGLKMGMSRPMTSDAQFYLLISRSLADGHGYLLREGFWPDTPTMTRSPAWPFTVSLALRIFHGASPDLVMRILALLINSLVAVLVAVLVRRLLSCPVVALLRKSPKDSPSSTTQQPNNLTTIVSCGLAALIYILHPQALYLAYGGASEILFLALALGGTILLLPRMGEVVGCQVAGLLSDGPEYSAVAITQQPSNPPTAPVNGQWSMVYGLFFLGLSCLVRPNFILWIVFAVGLGCVCRLLEMRRKQSQLSSCQVAELLSEGPFVPSATTNNQQPTTVRLVLTAILMVILFLAPSLLWAVRNYQVCGHFPVFSTLRGQTFYGGNNAVVANDPEQWGYWVFPNAIPGEAPMVELSKRMSEYEVDAYYNRKGSDYIQTHLKEMPRLWLGKLIRAYWPLPWKPSLGGYVAGAFRGGLYVAAVLGLIVGWRRLSRKYLVIVAAMVLANIVTVVVFWGCSRFAFAVEPFLIPLAVLGVMKVKSTLIERSLLSRG